MAKKKQPHTERGTKPFGADMLKKAALTQMGPDIERTILHYINQYADKLAAEQLGTIKELYTRIVELEQIIIENKMVTKEELADRIAARQDLSEGYQKSDEASKGDRVRIQIESKALDQTEFQGVSRLMINDIGSGKTLGNEIESGILGMKTGEAKEIAFGKDLGMLCKVTLHRASSKIATLKAVEDLPTEEATTQGEGNESSPA